jgi:hypothetical protein
MICAAEPAPFVTTLATFEKGDRPDEETVALILAICGFHLRKAWERMIEDRPGVNS